MSRLLVLELSDEGELDVSESSDEWSAWELLGIAGWLQRVGEDNLVSEDE